MNFVTVRRHKIIYKGKKSILLSLRNVSSSKKLEQETHNNKMLKMLHSAVSYDLMTPLCCITIFVDLILSRQKNVPPEEKLKMLNQIKSSARVIQFKMHDMLDLALLENGQIQVKNDHFMLRAVLNEII